MSKDKNQIDFHKENHIDFHNRNYKDFLNKRKIPAVTIEIPVIEYYDKKQTKPRFRIDVWGFFSTGSLKSMACINRNGKLDGLSEEWHRNGQKKIETNWVKDKKHGLWTTWHPNGQKGREGNFVNGELHGEWKFFDRDGNITNIDTYDNGKLLKKPCKFDLDIVGV